ncbi:MAG: acyltransferase [Bacteroidota bacterium]
MERLRPLTSLRFFFALAVFGLHCDFLGRSGDHLTEEFFHYWLIEGHLGVTFFFILSGFILSHAYGGARLKSKAAFYWGRIGRIYPLHLLVFLGALPLYRNQLWATGGGLKAILHTTLTQSYWLDRSLYKGFNTPAWSLCDELFFYLLFPFLLVFVNWAFRRFDTRAFCLAAVLLVVPLGMALTPPSLDHALWYIHPVPRLGDFFLGMLLYRAFLFWRGRRCKGSTLWEAVAVCVLLLWIYHAPLVPQVHRFSVYYWPPMVVIIGLFALGGGRLSRWLSHPWWVHLGEISFAFYLLHRPIMGYYEVFQAKVWSFDNPYLDVLVLLCATLVASHLVYRYFERPVYRWFR